ncbi:MAG: phosphodiester glycosidase family protein [Candidatus Obscuribacterales bacterium]
MQKFHIVGLSVVAAAVALLSAQLGSATSSGSISLYPRDGAKFYTREMTNGSKAYVIEIDKNSQWQFRVAVGEKTEPTSRLSEKNGASAGINAGYFNMTDGVSASYITVDGKQVADPHLNRALVENPRLKPHLEKIFDRTEVRFYQDKKGNKTIAIAAHNAPVPEALTLMQSIQAGPRLVPEVTARQEAFLRTEPDGKEADSIGVLRPAARTAFGTTSDGRAFMVTVAGKGQDPESSGVTLDQLAVFMKELGCTAAINFDGGASSTLYAKLCEPGHCDAGQPPPTGRVLCGKTPETLVKSALLLVPSKRR